jgi:hypothetical protein
MARWQHDPRRVYIITVSMHTYRLTYCFGITELVTCEDMVMFSHEEELESLN